MSHMNVSERALANLIENAYDFLEGALSALDKDPKRSVIDFYAAVELFLKAPLMNEHWTLIVKGHASVSNFRSGNFQSIGLEDATIRLQNVLAQPLPQATKEAFKTIGAHRNRYVHFYVTETTQNQQNIALEQLRAWAGLQRFIQHTWSELFDAYSERTEKIQNSLRRHKEFVHEFAKVRMPDILDKLSEFKEEEIATCNVCKTRSAIINSEVEGHEDKHCLICSCNTLGVLLVCPHCGKKTSIEEDGTSAWCEACDEYISEDELYEALDTEPTTHHNYYYKSTPATCGRCGGYESVCTYHDHFLCASCFILSKSLYSCGWCNSNFNVPQEDSEWAGCEHCEGAAGRVKDD